MVILMTEYLPSDGDVVGLIPSEIILKISEIRSALGEKVRNGHAWSHSEFLRECEAVTSVYLGHISSLTSNGCCETETTMLEGQKHKILHSGSHFNQGLKQD